jgi:hypothetical protein
MNQMHCDKRKIKFLILIGLGVIPFSILYFFNPVQTPFFPVCPFHALTGLYCPGCGTARAIHQLLHGHLLRALSLNPLMIISLPFLGYSLAAFIFGKSESGKKYSNWRTVWDRSVLFIVLIYWVLRNIPWYPFTLLAP